MGESSSYEDISDVPVSSDCSWRCNHMWGEGKRVQLKLMFIHLTPRFTSASAHARSG